MKKAILIYIKECRVRAPHAAVLGPARVFERLIGLIVFVRGGRCAYWVEARHPAFLCRMSDPQTKVRWWNKVYRGRAFEHRMQAGVAMSIGIVMVVIPLSILRIKELKNKEAPRVDDQRSDLIRQKIWKQRRLLRESAVAAKPEI